MLLLGAEEHTVIHTPFYHRCSLLLLFLCSLICSPHQKLCWVILEHRLCIFGEGRKRISDGISEIYSVGFGPGWWDPVRLIGVRASCPRASECTRMFVHFSFLHLSGSVVETKPGLAHHCTKQGLGLGDSISQGEVTFLLSAKHMTLHFPHRCMRA